MSVQLTPPLKLIIIIHSANKSIHIALTTPTVLCRVTTLKSGIRGQKESFWDPNQVVFIDRWSLRAGSRPGIQEIQLLIPSPPPPPVPPPSCLKACVSYTHLNLYVCGQL